MGLDSVEIIMEIENAFGIRIPDIAAEKARTVGDLHDIVWEMVKDHDTSYCNSQRTFYKLRSLIREELLIREQLSPTTSLEEIFPKSDRRKIWKQMANRSSLKFPELTLSNLGSSVFKSFRNSFAVVTMGDLTNKVVELNFGVFKPAGIPRKEVEVIINNIISDRAGIELSDISPEKSFVDDLGIN